MSKLTADQRAAIILDPRPHAVVAAEYGLNKVSVSRLRSIARTKGRTTAYAAPTPKGETRLLVAQVYTDPVYLEYVDDYVAEMKTQNVNNPNRTEVIREALRVFFLGDSFRQLPRPKTEGRRVCPLCRSDVRHSKTEG